MRLRKKYFNLTYCGVNFASSDDATNENIEAILDDFGSLTELAFHNEAPHLDLIKQYTKNLRVYVYLPQKQNNKDEYDTHVFNFCSTDSLGEYEVRSPIQIQNATCGASIGRFTIIGTDTGVLYIYKLEGRALKLQRVVSNLHTEAVTSATVTQENGRILVTSLVSHIYQFINIIYHFLQKGRVFRTSLVRFVLAVLKRNFINFIRLLGRLGIRVDSRYGFSWKPDGYIFGLVRADAVPRADLPRFLSE